MRNRLLAGVALCSVAVIAAGVPGLVDASGDLSEAQDLVELSELNHQAITLSHSLADERQAVMAYVAQGRSAESGGLTAAQRARVDRQLAEFRAQAPERMRLLLGTLPEQRRRALAGDATVNAVQETYGGLIEALNGIAAETARTLPSRAQADGAGRSTAEALPFLVRAVEQAAVTRESLSVALAGEGPQAIRVTAAQRAYLREQAALADFHQLAAGTARDSFTETVNGHDVALAERFLAELTDQPSLYPTDRALGRQRVETALSARIDLMRGVVSSLSVAETERLKSLRDDDVTGWEIRVALLAGCLLFAIGVSVHTARSMTRPLAALRLGSGRVAADPVGEEPVAYTGRNDEFAEVVRAVNQLRETAVTLHERTAGTDADRTRLVGTRDRLAAEREALVREYEEVRQRLAAVQSTAHGAFAQLGARTAELIDRQLTTVREMREREVDPTRRNALETVDRLTVRMWRHSANLLLLSEAEQHAVETAPWPLSAVLDAALGQIESGDRVRSLVMPTDVEVAGAVAVDLRRMVAELLDNAVSFSAADTEVELEGQLTQSGELALRVLDQGIGMTTGRMSELNEWFSDPARLPVPSPDGNDVLRVGLYVVARLAARHRVRVRLSALRQGGIVAEMVLGSDLLSRRPSAGAARSGAVATGSASPDADLTPRTAPRAAPGPAGGAEPVARPTEPVGLARSEDPLIAAAERAEQAARELRAADEAGKVVEGAPPSAASGDLTDEVQAPDALVRAAGPFLVEQEEHARPTAEDGVTTLPVDAQARPTVSGVPGATAHTGAVDDTVDAASAGVGTVSATQGAMTAAELRQRLGGLQQGARDGRRDVAAEFGADSDGSANPRDDGEHGARSGGQGSHDTVEERSE